MIQCQEEKPNKSLSNLKSKSTRIFSECVSEGYSLLKEYPILSSNMNNLYGIPTDIISKQYKQRLDNIKSNFKKNFTDYNKSCNLWYIGGNKHCETGVKLAPVFSKIIVYEPVLSFLPDLEKAMQTIKGVTPYQIKTYGLGNQNFTIQVKNNDKGTSVLRDVSCEDSKTCEKLLIKDASWALLEDGLKPDECNFLYTNCEGCEISVMQSLIQNNLVHYFKYFHLATHVVSDKNHTSKYYVKQHCMNMAKISKHYYKVDGLFFAQERWMKMS